MRERDVGYAAVDRDIAFLRGLQIVRSKEPRIARAATTEGAGSRSRRGGEAPRERLDRTDLIMRGLMECHPERDIVTCQRQADHVTP